MINRTIFGYTILDRLGEGGMAEVYYAENKIHKKAAVKFLKKKFCDDENIVTRFRNEAEVMVALDHPNIRQVFDYAELDGQPAIIMEYLEGDDLKSLIKGGRRFSGAEVTRLWDSLCDALNYTHAKGIVHRDIKPSNIFITNKGVVKLLDFGIAKIKDAVSGTQTGQKMGTLLYMSPEQIKDSKHVDHRTDVYSLAVTFVNILTGKQPYNEDSSSEYAIMDKIVSEPLDMTGVPGEWRVFLSPYLAKNPADRPALVHFGGGAVASDGPSNGKSHDFEGTIVENARQPEPTPQPEPKRNLTWLWILLGVLALGGVVSGVKSVIENKRERIERQIAAENERKAQEAECQRQIAAENVVAENEMMAQEVPARFKDKTFTVNGVSFEMVAVKGGTFTMGATSEQGGDAWNNEKPAHSVTLSDYYIGKYEVTQELWEAVMGSNPNYSKGSRLPVEEVNWYEAVEFCNRLSDETGRRPYYSIDKERKNPNSESEYDDLKWTVRVNPGADGFRLPTEAEWEYAARGGNRSRGYKYSGSNSIGNVAWYADNSGSKTHAVGTKSPNELGIYDMSGNVSEWCQDWYGSYGSGSQTNPQGPSSGSYRVLRGGSWVYDGARYCRVSFRGYVIPDYGYGIYGLRLAL